LALKNNLKMKTIDLTKLKSYSKLDVVLKYFYFNSQQGFVYNILEEAFIINEPELAQIIDKLFEDKLIKSWESKSDENSFTTYGITFMGKFFFLKRVDIGSWD
jgi:hypothetical protein